MNKLVAKIYLFSLIFVFSCSPFKDLNTIDVNKDFQKEFREYKKEYRKDVLKDPHDWDIVLEPIEVIPTDITKDTRGLAGITNWGEQLLLPNDLRDRVKAECKFPVVVKILDTGGKWTHNDLQEGQLPGQSYTGEANKEDVQGHSTHVMGIVAGRGFGLAYDLVSSGLLKYKALKVLNDSGQGSFSWIIQAVRDQRSEDADLKADNVAVLYNGSLGGGSGIVSGLETELKKSIDQGGAFFFFASGNNGSYVEYPGKSQYTIATAAIGRDLKKASFSSPGPEVDYAKPGVSIQSTWRNNTYAYLSGTSMATPFMTAAGAIALSKWGLQKLPNQYALNTYLQKVATDLEAPGKDNLTGWGLTYVSAILDTEPGEAPDNPSPGPDPDPEPEPEPGPTRPYPVDYTFNLSDQNYTIVWRPQGGTDKILEVTDIRFKLSDQTRPFDVVEAEISEKVQSYFKNRGLVLLPHHDQYDATYWTIRFLYMLRFKGIDIETIHVTTQDRKSKAIIYRSDIMEQMIDKIKDYGFGGDRLYSIDKKLFTPFPEGVFTYTQ